MTTIFIEGTSSDKNGNLREGFAKLFSQMIKYPNPRPKIILGDDKHSTIRKFKADRKSSKKILLIDLDDSHDKKESIIKELSLEADLTFFMIQEMEAWFLSQSKILDSYYDNAIFSSYMKGKVAENIPNPSGLLSSLAKKSSKAEYHKVGHATALLGRLDLKVLEKDFIDVKKLIPELA